MGSRDDLIARWAMLAALALPACCAPNAPGGAAPAAAARDPHTFSISGRVLSDLDETVTLKLDTVVPWMDGMERTLPKQHFEAEIAPGGSYRFEGLSPGVYWVVASSPSSALWTYDQVKVLGNVTGHEIHVRKACTVLGHVVFGEGIDPADCWIEWTMRNTGTSLGRGVKPNGRFRLERLEPGPVSILVRHWPDRDPAGTPALRVESTAEATLVPGDNVVEWTIDKDSAPAK